MSTQTPVTTLEIDDQEVSTSTNTTGEFSTIIDIQVPHGYRYEFPKGYPIEMFVYTHESASVAANTDGTVNLSNNLVNSPAVADIPQSNDAETSTTGQYSLVVWDDNDDIQTGVDAVDYAANSFDYDNTDGSQDNLEVFYLWGDSSQVEFRSYTPDEERFEKEIIKTMREFHSASTFSRQSYITFPETLTLRSKEHLKVTLKTDVDLTNWDVYDDNQGGGPGNFTTFSYSSFEIPVRKIPEK